MREVVTKCALSSSGPCLQLANDTFKRGIFPRGKDGLLWFCSVSDVSALLQRAASPSNRIIHGYEGSLECFQFSMEKIELLSSLRQICPNMD